MVELTPEERQRIYEEEKARLEAGELVSPLWRLFSSKKHFVIAFCILLVLTGIGSLAYHEYRMRGIRQRLSEAIGRGLGLTEIILKAGNDGSSVTFDEVFRLCEKSVENQTSLIADLRGVYPEIDSQLKSRLIKFFSTVTELVRAKREYNQKQLDFLEISDIYFVQKHSYLRIPSDSDQRSELIPIAIPNSCRSPFQSDGDHRSKLMPITVRRG